MGHYNRKKGLAGMKQRLGIAATIMEEPEIILLDEPINALDEGGVQEIREVLLELRDRNRVIIIACHDREELETLSDEIIELYERNITKKMHQSI